MSQNNYFTIRMLIGDAKDVAAKLFHSFDKCSLENEVYYEQDSNVIDEALTFESIIAERFSFGDRLFLEHFTNETFQYHMLEVRNELMELIREVDFMDKEEEVEEQAEDEAEGHFEVDGDVYNAKGEYIGKFIKNEKQVNLNLEKIEIYHEELGCDLWYLINIDREVFDIEDETKKYGKYDCISKVWISGGPMRIEDLDDSEDEEL
jgi:hypothetical protein